MHVGRGFRAGIALVLVATAAAVLVPSAASAARDRTPPTAPTNLRVETLSFTWLTLAWNASTDNAGPPMYDARIDTPEGLTTARAFGTSQSFGGLEAGATYTAFVRAVDLAGNRSAEVSIQFTTLPRTQPPPTAPANLRAVFVAGQLDRIAWDASTHDSPVSYVLFSGSDALVATWETSVTIRHLVFTEGVVDLGSTHTLTVQAYGANNHLSAHSAPLTVTIPLMVPVRP
jgi:hypothetical protein